MSKELSLQETGDLLLQAQKIVLCTHVSPDGDTLGSTLGLAQFLLQRGKEITVLCDDLVHAGFDYIPAIDLVQRPEAGQIIDADLLVVIDASSFDRIGIVPEVVKYKQLLNIDHHISNTRFADYLYLDAQAAATGEIMCDLFQAMEWPLEQAIAEDFYVAITSDCGFFRYANTTPKTMRVAAMLMEHGVQPNAMSDKQECKPRETMELLAKVMPSLTFDSCGRIAYMTITNDLYDKEVNTDSFVNYVRYIDCVDVAILFKAVEKDVTRVSMRSSETDVAQVALSFGGGGHIRAAGCTIYAPVEEAQKQLLDRLKPLVYKRLGIGEDGRDF